MLTSATLLVAAAALAQPAVSPNIRDGDRLVWLGNTLVEREQRYGYWETALYAAYPGKKFTVRNLGWSGDTVYGDARAGFDSPAKGYERMVSLTLELKPTTIWVCYGANESFDGPAGLPRFEQGLGKLVASLRAANARIVLFTPAPVQACPGHLTPDQAAARNEQIKLYAAAIRDFAAKSNMQLVDWFHALGGGFAHGPITENGVHPTEAGYRDTAAGFLGALRFPPQTIDWERWDAVRRAVVAKNELFFHRWRPQNETYLFGFRRHEQGKNAVEVAAFDPLVAKAEEAVEAARAAVR